MEQYLLPSQPESQDSQSAFGFEEPPSSSLPTRLPDPNDSEGDSPDGFTLSPNKRYIIWREDQHNKWKAYWAHTLLRHPNRAQSESIRWARPKKSQVWNSFYQGIETKTLLPKALCRSCWKAFAHPELRKAGSSTSTLSRHADKCRPQSSQQLSLDTGTIDVSSTFP
jgi:hypothetical protein